ncbi:hypothetical protein [Leucobacter sp. USHLN153]|uniref:hypothetical protein n=1 Tax=Leucobacter sp. USHLN153 TaxID=3081268 RepID=UPI00301A6417
MSDSSRVGAESGAKETVWSLGEYDPSAPSPDQLAAVSGTRAASAQFYVDTLQWAGGSFAAEFSQLLTRIQQDCAESAQAIQALHDLDEEIGATLRGVNVEGLTQSRGGPQISPAGDGGTSSNQSWG